MTTTPPATVPLEGLAFPDFSSIRSGAGTAPAPTTTAPLTPAELEDLKRLSIAAKDRAYCPYSKFRVGAALLCEDGEFVTGANVENASYPVGICAERTALVKAITEGKMRYRALGVATDITPAASPCGMCRQFIREFAALEMPVYMFDGKGEHSVMTVNQLLPNSFGPDQLPGQGPGA